VATELAGQCPPSQTAFSVGRRDRRRRWDGAGQGHSADTEPVGARRGIGAGQGFRRPDRRHALQFARAVRPARLQAGDLQQADHRRRHPARRVRLAGAEEASSTGSAPKCWRPPGSRSWRSRTWPRRRGTQPAPDLTACRHGAGRSWKSEKGPQVDVGPQPGNAGRCPRRSLGTLTAGRARTTRDDDASGSANDSA
jgi:hypothetical protein